MNNSDPFFHERNLNPEQNLIFQRIINDTTAGNKFCLFVSGTAGTGKSHLIRAIIGRLEKKNLVVCAPTALAAKAIQGQTIHSAFRLDYANQSLEETMEPPNLLNIKLVIIDEISQCGAQLFDRLERRLRQILNVDEAFGNCNVVMFGDLLQIPPVRQLSIFESKHWLNVQYAELTINQRQLTDPEFAGMLSRWRFGRFSEIDLEFLRSRILLVPDTADHCLRSKIDGDLVQIVGRFLESVKPNSMILSPWNINVAKINSTALNQQFDKTLVPLTREIHAIPLGGGPSIKSYEPEFELALGARVMVTQNLSLCGLANGQIATVCHIEKNEEDKVIAVNLVPEFETNNIRVTLVKKQLDPVGFAERYCLHIPIQPCYAATYHRAQGQTLDKVYLEVGPRMDTGLFFVGASRVRSRNDFFLVSHNFETVDQFLHNFPNVIRADQKAIQEYSRLNSF